jgi:hypothetical protein
MATKDEPIMLESIVDKQISDDIDTPLERAARVKCDEAVRVAYHLIAKVGTHRNCIDPQLRPNGRLTKGWHEADPKKMCASCACYWHLSCARNFALGVVR